MAQITREQVIEALKTVVDTEKGIDVVSQGMVTGLVVTDGHVGFALEVDPSRGEKAEPLRRRAETVVGDLDGVLSVTAVLTAHREQDTPVAGGPRQQGQVAPEDVTKLLPQVKSIVAVASGKGGVGKSTTAVNLAVAMAAKGLEVGLLDADIYGPSQQRMLNLVGVEPQSTDGRNLDPLLAYGIKVMSMGVLVGEDTPMIWRGPMVMQALEQFLRDVAWGKLDCLVIDLPPGTGDAQLTMAQRVPLTGAVIVSTPQDIALIDAKKGISMFGKVDVPVLGIIENMSYYSCPQCGHRAEIFGHGGAKQEAEKTGVPFLGEVPLDIEIRELSDQGRPIVAAAPDSVHAKSYMDIADKVWTSVQEKTGAAEKGKPRIVVS